MFDDYRSQMLQTDGRRDRWQAIATPRFYTMCRTVITAECDSTDITCNHVLYMSATATLKNCITWGLAKPSLAEVLWATWGVGKQHQFTLNSGYVHISLMRIAAGQFTFIEFWTRNLRCWCPCTWEATQWTNRAVTKIRSNRSSNVVKLSWKDSFKSLNSSAILCKCFET